MGAYDMLTKINLWKHETFLIVLVSTQIMSIRVYIQHNIISNVH